MWLVVAPFVPVSSASQAGHRLLHDYLVAKAKEMPVHLVVLASEREWDEVGNISIPGVKVIKAFEFGRLKRLISILWNSLTHAPRFCTRLSDETACYLVQLCRQYQYSGIRLEFSQTMAYGEILAKQCPEVSIEYGIHDVQLQVVLRKKAWEGFLFARKTYATEKRLLSVGGTVFTLCDKDSNLIRSLYGEHIRCVKVPIVLPDWVSRVKRVPENIEPYSFMFWGAMNRVENEEAALWFIDKVFLPARKRTGRGVFYVVGARPSEKLKARQVDGVIVTGFVDDPVPYFNKVAFGVVPLFSGAGIKLKTLEMQASSVPILATDIGAEGVDLDCGAVEILSAEKFLPRVDEILSNECL